MTQLNQWQLGATLKRRRKGLRLGLRGVSHQTGISASTLSRIENGKGHQLEVKNFLLICDWLGVSPMTFITESTEASVMDAPRLNYLEMIEAALRSCPEEPELCRALADVIRATRDDMT